MPASPRAPAPGRPLGLRSRLRAKAGGAGTGTYSALLAVLGLAVVGAIGLLAHQPWLFPSLGPTVMVMAETPRQVSARPVAVVVGHAIGLLVGYLSLVVTGLTSAPPVIQEGITAARIVAACLSVALTAFVLQAVRCPHPPAGATTLIVSLGILTSTRDLLVIMCSVLALVAVLTAANAVLGTPQAGVRGGP